MECYYPEHYSQTYRVDEKRLHGLCCCTWWSHALLTSHWPYVYFSVDVLTLINDCAFKKKKNCHQHLLFRYFRNPNISWWYVLMLFSTHIWMNECIEGAILQRTCVNLWILTSHVTFEFLKTRTSCYICSFTGLYQPCYNLTTIFVISLNRILETSILAVLQKEPLFWYV